MGERGGLTPIRWPAEAIWEAVVPQLPDFTVEVLPSIDSTNTELMRRARAGQLEPILLVAERQSAGRGRLGRQWQSDAEGLGGTLTFSLGLPLALADWSGLSLAVGVSVVNSLHPDLGLKWPNDVWLQDRKLGGILIETMSVGAVRYVVIGMGLNILPRDPTGLSLPPACLQEVQPGMDAPTALQRVVPPLVLALQLFESQGFAPFQARFAERDVLVGRAVLLSDGMAGQAKGVAVDGALLVQTAEGLQRVTSAEVSVRPVASPDSPSLTSSPAPSAPSPTC